MFPSWIRSRNGTPRPMYFLATLMTSRELAVIRCSRADHPSSIPDCSSDRRRISATPRASDSRASLPRSIRLASVTSSMAVSSGTRPTSLRYRPIVSSASIAER